MTFDELQPILAADPQPQVMLPGVAMAFMTKAPKQPGDPCEISIDGRSVPYPLEDIEIAGGLLLMIQAPGAEH